MERAENKELVRQQFTKTAAAFGDYALAARGVEAGKLIGMVRAGERDRAVDVACGPGTLALRFAPEVSWICGVDLTPAILGRARTAAFQQGIENMNFAIGDAQHLPFADGSLDIAITSYALHHMPDAPSAIAEMARVLRPGGRLGIIDIFASENRDVAALNDRIECARDASHTCTQTRSNFEEAFRANGLSVTGAQTQENARAFDHWLHVAGWHRGDAPYEQARRLMESTLESDGAGFHPRYEASSPDGEKELMITNTILLIVGEKA